MIILLMNELNELGTGGAPATRKKFITIQHSDKSNVTSAIKTNEVNYNSE